MKSVALYYSTLLLVALFSLGCGQGKSDFPKNELDENTDTTEVVYLQIKSLDLESMVGKPVEDLLESIGYQYSEIGYQDDPPYYLIGAYIGYSKELYIKVINRNLKYLPYYLEPKDWDEELYKQEEISEIHVYYKDKYTINVVRVTGED